MKYSDARDVRAALIVPLALALTMTMTMTMACRPTPTGPGSPKPGSADRSVVIVAVNDVYRIEGNDNGRIGGLARLRTVRAELEKTYPDMLLLHAGDALYPSLLSRLYDGEHMIDVLNRLDGAPDGFDERMFFTIGNHEFDSGDLEDAPVLDKRITESQFRWLDTNIEFATGADGKPLIAADNLVPHALVESGGIKIGIFGLTTNLAQPAYVTRFGAPEVHAIAATKALREQGAELVIALTHLRIERDAEFLGKTGDRGPDIVIGGHEHGRQHRNIDGRMILKADAEAATATVIRVTVNDQGPPTVSCLVPGEPPECYYRTLDGTVQPDPDVAASIDGWNQRFNSEACGKYDKPNTCLDEPLGRTNVDLIAEETQIRKYETNMGTWVVDQQLAAFAEQGAQAAIINSGSLRLNQNLSAGSTLTRRTVEEMFAFPTPLVLMRVKGSTLQKAIAHSVTDWTANGRWLQVSGIAFRHNPDTTTADSLTLVTASGRQKIAPDQDILLVVGDYIAGGGDGYTMLAEGEIIPTPQPPLDLKALVAQALKAAGEAGISPSVEGRICNTQKTSPAVECQAVIDAP